ncbi:MAG: PAAR domain-containing protein [Hyphomicrobiales bacterium]|jgi:uncharacterized Zn-binding protein involved in type VI secretion|uniref:PAAR domain-containing protein n=1 Tax=Rhabdaerophilum calidifontis TaxID=2604328 RepID=UPI001238DDD3|nr:PAAR domain-containing protein [Rhabdaerophilum calidifontis]MCA1999869.1 PAAR domain-containing protein [Hyphomicrobiales bacterium]
MSRPAARLTDMHTCPIIAPGMLPIAMIGALNVLMGGLPAARVTDVCACVPPPVPDPIVTGAWNVLVAGLPAARIGDLTGKGGAIVTGLPTVLIAP